MPLKIVRNDITKMQVDAIVNTANPRPIVGGGVDRAIHMAAGAELLVARKKIGDIGIGKAVITPAYKLHARFVIHTAGPVWQGGGQGEWELLADCYANSLRLVAEHQCASVAFPLISAGVYGCPSEIAIAVATQAIREFLADHDMDVYLVVFDQKAFKISSSLFDDVQSFIDERYIEELLDEEYRGDLRERRRNFEAAGQSSHARQERSTASEAPGQQSTEDAYIDIPRWMRKPKERSLEDLLKEVDDTFSEALLRLIDAKGKTDPEVYKRANVDRKLFSKIRNNPAYKPSKATAIAFAVALELNLDETKDFIGRAGYALSRSSKADIIVEYFIQRQEYDLFTINETLFAFQQPLLGC